LTQFVGTLPVPKTIDSGGGTLLTSLAIDAALLGVFAVQHSVMARPAFKRWWTQIVSSIAMILLFWQWRPVGSVLWDVTGSGAAVVINVLCCFGWLGVLTSTFLINFDLFGLRRMYLKPIMLGFIVAFWATPRMTVGHLVFAIATTAYVLIALQLEEHDLAESQQRRFLSNG